MQIAAILGRISGLVFGHRSRILLWASVSYGFRGGQRDEEESVQERVLCARYVGLSMSAANGLGAHQQRQGRGQTLGENGSEAVDEVQVANTSSAELLRLSYPARRQASKKDSRPGTIFIYTKKG
jgi:hypothetical protein